MSRLIFTPHNCSSLGYYKGYFHLAIGGIVGDNILQLLADVFGIRHLLSYIAGMSDQTGVY